MRRDRLANGTRWHSDREAFLLVLFIAALGAGACGGRKEPAKTKHDMQPTSARASKETKSCAERVDQLRAALRTHLRTPPISVAVALPTAPNHAVELGGVADGIVITVTGDGPIDVHGRPVALTHLTREVVASIGLIELEKQVTPTIYIAADRHAPASRLAAVERRLPIRYPIRLIVGPALRDSDPFDDPGVPVGPAEQQWMTEFRATDQSPASRQEFLARSLQRAIGSGCQELTEAFTAAADSAPEQRREIVADHMPSALQRCACRGVAPLFDFLLVLLSSSGAPALSTVEVPRNLRVDKAATVEQAAQRLVGE